MERFLHVGHFSVASIYAPILFPPLPMIILKRDGDNAAPAVATTKCSIFLQCSLQRSKNGRVVKSKLPSLDTSDLACKPKNMSNPDNLTKASRTIFIQARGLDKLVTLLLVKATTLDIRQSSTLDNLFRTQISLELEGLMYCPESTK
ncbi:hypothetical protein JHK82_027727 [Glycine max]|nr:hypothetical protein JHK87_027635 [Glycine soja]KAG5126892.1 hypothetical protein JHK82_027727 [Glycine max]